MKPTATLGGGQMKVPVFMIIVGIIFLCIFGLNGIWAAVLISHVVASIAASITGTVLARKNTAIPEKF